MDAELIGNEHVQCRKKKWLSESARKDFGNLKDDKGRIIAHLFNITSPLRP